MKASSERIKLLLSAHHKNVVRAFGHFLYPDQYAGYIIMEHVDGEEIDSYVRNSPEKLDDLFRQAVEGFAYLETKGILHRDIRPANLMVGKSGELKIIDLGFGKKVATSADYQKSVTLNWAATVPLDFVYGRYDFGTEVYFVGKLFESLLQFDDIGLFSYTDLLHDMCLPEPSRRLKSFSEVERRLGADRFSEASFTEEAVDTYRRFADAVSNALSTISKSAEYVTDLDQLHRGLKELLTRTMLERQIEDSACLLSILIKGSYRYYKVRRIDVQDLRDFVRLLGQVSEAEKRIIMNNLHSRLDGVLRQDRADTSDEDIPF